VYRIVIVLLAASNCPVATRLPDPSRSSIFDEFENEFNDFEFDQDEFDEYHGYNSEDYY